MAGRASDRAVGLEVRRGYRAAGPSLRRARRHRPLALPLAVRSLTAQPEAAARTARLMDGTEPQAARTVRLMDGTKPEPGEALQPLSARGLCLPYGYNLRSMETAGERRLLRGVGRSRFTLYLSPSVGPPGNSIWILSRSLARYKRGPDTIPSHQSHRPQRASARVLAIDRFQKTNRHSQHKPLAVRVWTGTMLTDGADELKTKSHTSSSPNSFVAPSLWTIRVTTL